MLDYQIEDFWNRFRNHVQILKSDPYEDAFIRFIDETIANWDLSWEMGPGKCKEFSLTISPGGRPDLIEKVSQIISKAPLLDTWEYYGFKQPKENWFSAHLVDPSIAVNAKSWMHQLRQYAEGDFELSLRADNIRDLDLESQELIADLVITNLLGEEIKMNSIACIEMVNSFEDFESTTKLEYLPLQIARAMDRFYQKD